MIKTSVMPVAITIRDSNKNLYEDKSGFVTFPYNPDYVQIMRDLPLRWYNSDEKSWEIPVDSIAIVQEKIPNITIIGDIPSTDNNNIPTDYEWKTKPFNHQIVAVNYGLSHNKWLLGDEQGLGKTKTVIDIAIINKLNHDYKHCLIICGVNGLKYNWEKEIKTHSNENGWILGTRKGKVKGNAEKFEDLKNINSIDAFFLITNIESLRSSNIADEIKKLCNAGIINMIVVDEVHKCANPTSQQSKGLLQITADTQIALTGTPLMNTPLDLYLPLKWLGYENHAFYAYKKHYTIQGGYGGYEVVGYKNMDELQTRLSKIMLRRLKADVLDLPEKLYVDEYVEMGDKQKKLYFEVMKEIKANIDKIKMSSNPLAQLIRLRQATGYTGILSSVIKESAKLDRLEQLISDTLQNGKKAVVFSNWTQMTDNVVDRLKYYDPLLITGQTNPNDRQNIVDKFQNDDNYPVIVGTIGAMGTGLTLTAGTVIIFIDEPWTKALYDQAVDRCHRIGTTDNITVYNLLTKDTIDERVHEIINRKGAISDVLVDGKIKGNATEILNYLLS